MSGRRCLASFGRFEAASAALLAAERFLVLFGSRAARTEQNAAVAAFEHGEKVPIRTDG
jgi:hypothetical protein